MRGAIFNPGGQRLNGKTTAKLKGVGIQRKPSEASMAVALAAWDWPWWKDQIDLAVSVGANSLRQVITIAARGTTITTAAHDAIVHQVADYTAGLGLRQHWLLFEGGSATSGDLDNIAALATILNTYPHVVSFDGVNEIDLHATAAQAGTLAAAITARVRAVTNIPISYSLSRNFDSPYNTPSGYLGQLFPYVDFWDAHAYGSAYTAMANAMIPTPYRLPWLAGECNSAAGMGDSAAVTAAVTLGGTLLAQPDCMGVMYYTIKDYEAAPNNFGMFDASDVRRDAAYTPFSAWPSHA